MTFAYPLPRHSSAPTVSILAKRLLPFVAVLLGVSCGDVYRPVAQPLPGQSPTPAPVGHVAVVSTNGSDPANPFLGSGGLSRIDVSGDSVVSSTPTGVAPAVAALSATGRLYVPNSGEDTVFASPAIGSLQGTTIDLAPVCSGSFCPAANPVFVTSTESTRMYVAGAGNGTVSVIDTNINAVVHTYPVDSSQAQPDALSRPVALAELPNGSKIYSVNQGTNSVSSLNTLDGAINRVIPVGAAPLWAAANADNLHVYVLDSAGAIWLVDSTTETAAKVPYGAAGPLPNHLVYDKAFNRVFATDANSSPAKVAFFDVTSTPGNPNGSIVPHGPGTASILAAPGSLCSSNPIPTSVAVLGDGSRAYVASYQTGGGLICTQATVIDTASGSVTKTIPLSVATDNPAQTDCNAARFRVYAASSIGGTNSLFKVYVSQCDAGTTAIIDTSAVSVGPSQHPADSLVGWVSSPVSSFPGSQISISGASQPANSAVITYTYTTLSGPPIQPGMTVYVSGLAQLNGAFVVRTVGSSTFDVVSSSTPPTTSVSDTTQTGAGSVIPPQNPVFLVPGS